MKKKLIYFLVIFACFSFVGSNNTSLSGACVTLDGVKDNGRCDRSIPTNKKCIAVFDGTEKDCTTTADIGRIRKIRYYN